MLLETDKKILGYKLRKYRKSKRMTQFELAEKAGLNEKQISRIESGLNYPTYLTFVKLIDILDINLSDFICQTPLTDNPLLDEIIYLSRNATSEELKTYIDVIKVLKKRINGASA